MKKNITSLTLALVFALTLFPLQALAAGRGDVTLSASEQSIVIEVEIPGAQQEGITSMQLSLGITMTSLDWGHAQIQFQFEDSVTGRVRDFRLRSSTEAITIYIAGTDSLFVDGDTITVGTLSINNAENTEVSFLSNSLKTVNGAYFEETLSEATGNSVVLTKAESGEETQPSEGEQETPSPGTETNSPNSSQGSETSNPSSPSQGETSQQGGTIGSTSGITVNVNTLQGTDSTENSDNGSTLDKAGLEEAIEIASDYNEEDYTEESYQVMKEALETAQKVYNDPQASQQDVDVATMNLQNAIGALQFSDSDIYSEGNMESGNDSDEDSETESSVTENSERNGFGTFQIVLSAIGAVAVIFVVVTVISLKNKKSQRTRKHLKH